MSLLVCFYFIHIMIVLKVSLNLNVLLLYTIFFYITTLLEMLPLHVNEARDYK